MIGNFIIYAMIKIVKLSERKYVRPVVCQKSVKVFFLMHFFNKLLKCIRKKKMFG